jgi:hypothetical protein
VPGTDHALRRAAARSGSQFVTSHNDDIRGVSNSMGPPSGGSSVLHFLAAIPTRFWVGVAALSALLMLTAALVGAAVLGDVILVWPLAMIGWPVVGGVLVARRPEHAIGKLMVALSLAIALTNATEAYIFSGQEGLALPAIEAVSWSSMWVFTPVWAIVVFMVALFPSGYLSSGWLRWPLRACLGLTMVGIIGQMILPGVVVSASPEREFANPWGVESLRPLIPVGVAVYLGVMVVLVLAVFDLVLRWRRAIGIARLQMRALTLILAVAIAALASANLLWLLGLPDEQLYLANSLAGIPGLAALPVAIGVAVSKYRLYEIDRAISRTVSYTIVVAMLALVYVGGVFLLRELVPLGGDLAVAGSTLAVAALFNPLRRRVQRWVDRRFNRARYDAQQIADAFTEAVSHEVDPDQIVEEWITVVSRTMEPAAIRVWVRE